MLFTVPNSGGLPEPEQALVVPLSETWSDTARAASAAVRRARLKNPTKDEKKNRLKQSNLPGERPNDAAVKQVGAKVTQRTKAEQDAQKTAATSYEKIHADREAAKAADAKAAAAAAKKASSGGGGGGPKAPTATNDSHNAHGERVIQYSDGSTVTVHGDGTATHRKADGTETSGKYHDPTPAQPKDTPKGFKADTPESKHADAVRAQKAADKAARDRAKAARPVKQQTLRVKLSRTKKGPRAA